MEWQTGAVWSGSALFAYVVLSVTLVFEILGHLPYCVKLACKSTIECIFELFLHHCKTYMQEIANQHILQQKKMKYLYLFSPFFFFFFAVQKCCILFFSVFIYSSYSLNVISLIVSIRTCPLLQNLHHCFLWCYKGCQLFPSQHST